MVYSKVLWGLIVALIFIPFIKVDEKFEYEMMQSQETQLSELVSVGKELTAAFEGTQEAELTEKCARIISEIRHLQQKQREQLKQQIQGKYT